MEIYKKIFIVTVLFFLFLGMKAYAEIVNKIALEGNERIALETIVVFGDIKIGENYEREDVNLLIKKLYDTSFFSNISVELSKGILNITLQENPIINTIVIEGEKAKKYRKAIKELFTLREKNSFIRNNVKSDINVLKEFYRAQGYYFTKIDVDVEKIDKNRVNLIYSLQKGKKAKISKIHFLGDKKIRERRLRDIITSQESKFWKVISKNVYLNKKRIELDERLLKNYYRNRGYYEVDISSSSVEFQEGEGFVLTFSINAGTRYKFKKIFADVSDALDKSAFSSLEKEFNQVVGEYYSQKSLTSILEKIDKLSDQKELQFINHRVVEKLDGNGVEVKIEIYEGQKFIIERINIAGNSITNDSVIRSTMLVDEGDPYSALLINKSINKLKSKRIFGNVEHQISEGSSPGLKVLQIEVEEQATGEISAGAGVGTRGTAFMFAISENNWLGKGMKLLTSANVTQETLSGSVAVTQPNWNYTDNSLFASFDLSSSDMTASSGYESSKTGTSFGTQFEQYENVYIAPEFNFSHEKIKVQSTASTAIKKMDGTYNNIDFAYGITWDKRNQPYRPTKGFRSKFYQSLPILQDTSSFVNGFETKGYHAFSENLVGVGKIYVRTIHGVGEDVRLTNRLFVPQNLLRGFNTKRTGPKDGIDYIGGNYVTTLNFEAQLPNILPESTKTDFSVFLDAANVWSVDYNSNLDDTNKIRSSFGIAANVFTPVGPLSFTLAQSITKARHDETETFSFQLGTSF